MNDLCDPYVVRFSPLMTQAHVEGRKCCTTRRHVIGKVGQVFVDENLPGQQFRILSCAPMMLDDVKNMAYRLEGFRTQGEFQSFWRGIYGEYHGQDVVYTHWYAPVLDSALVLNRGKSDE